MYYGTQALICIFFLLRNLRNADLSNENLCGVFICLETMETLTMTMETLGGKKRWASALSRELPSCALNEVRGRGPVLWALRKQDC